jgi:hypothetical protein
MKKNRIVFSLPLQSRSIASDADELKVKEKINNLRTR